MIADGMLTDLLDGKCTVEGLNRLTLESLKTEYGGSPNTAKFAREDAIARFSEFQKS
jgi:hypothetical protein